MNAALIERSEWLALGQSIRLRRHTLGLTLVELATDVGLSQPFLSQIENGRARPSMGSLYRIATALETTPQALFGRGEAAPTSPVLVRADHGEAIAVSDAASVDGLADSLCRVLLPGRAPFHVIEFLGLPAEFEHYWVHDGFEAVYVLDGFIQMDLDAVITQLGPGDFMSYPATTPHRFRSTVSVVRVLLIETPNLADNSSGDRVHASGW